MADFAALIREARLRAGLTQSELADKLREVSTVPFKQATISAWEMSRQMPERPRLREVAAALSKVLGLDQEEVMASGSAAPVAAQTSSHFVLRQELGTQIKKIESKNVWAINPSALAFATDRTIREIWITGIRDGRSYLVVWPLDLIQRGGFLRARDGFERLQESLALAEGGRPCEEWGKVTHYAFTRDAGPPGLLPLQEYEGIQRALASETFKFHPAFRIHTMEAESEDVGVRAVTVGKAPPILAKPDPSSVIQIDQACDRLAAFAQLNAGSVLYDAPEGPMLSTYHREVRSPDGTLSGGEGGVWRGETEALEMKDAMKRFIAAAQVFLSAPRDQSSQQKESSHAEAA